MLIKDYHAFLKRELQLIEKLNSYGLGNISLQEIKTMIKESYRNQNDLRFLLLLYLEGFKDEYSYANWNLEKNTISGVWMASTINEKIRFNKFITDIQVKFPKVKFWYHLELKAGLLEKSSNESIGEIQLKCACKGNNKPIWDIFRNNYILNSFEKFSRKPSLNYNSFYIIKKSLFEKELTFKELNNFINHFRSRFES